MQKAIVLVLCAALILPGCAARAGARATRASDPTMSPVSVAPVISVGEALARVPVGTRVRLDLAGGRRVRGTLMHADVTSVVINPRVRVPEPPVTIPVADVQGFDLEPSSNLARVIAIGAAAGAAAAVGVFWFVVAMIDD